MQSPMPPEGSDLTATIRSGSGVQTNPCIGSFSDNGPGRVYQCGTGRDMAAYFDVTVVMGV